VKYYQKNKKRKRKRVESNWRDYTGSNEVLNEEIKTGHNIEKEILHLCTGKAWLSYYETKEILLRDAIIDDMYYNGWLSAKIRKSQLK
jgi:hypothetical protein